MSVEMDLQVAENSKDKDQHNQRVKEIDIAHSKVVLGLNSRIAGVLKRVEKRKGMFTTTKVNPIRNPQSQ